MPTEKRTNGEAGEQPDAYGGLWVARIGSRIVAQAGTPEQALRAARARRSREHPLVSYMDLGRTLPPVLLQVLERLNPDQEIYLVGGGVRDLLLNRSGPDLDLVVPTGAIDVSRRLANSLGADFVVLDADRDIARLILHEPDGPRHMVDIAGFRGRKTLEQDLRDRDFTINAIAYDLRRDTLLDPMGGAGDLRAKQIRACSNEAFRNDPVRILRAVRLANTLGFKIEARTRNQMRDATEGLARLTAERLRDELFRILAGPKPEVVVRALDVLDALKHILPEIPPMKGIAQPPPHVHDTWGHTLATVQNLGTILDSLETDAASERRQDLMTGLLVGTLGGYAHRVAEHLQTSLNPDRPHRGLLCFAALYHDSGKPTTHSRDESGRVRFIEHELKGADLAERRGQALRLSALEVERIRTIVLNHMQFGFMAKHLLEDGSDPTGRSIYRFFRAAGPAGIDLVLLGLADLRAKQGPLLSQKTWKAALDVARVLVQHYWERPSVAVAPPRLVDGTDLMQALAISPGPIVGRLLEMIREAQAGGEITSRPEALEFARARLKEEPAG